jgi:hypothetical protein
MDRGLPPERSYSLRSACMGSTDAARLAGTMTAALAVSTITPQAATIKRGCGMPEA